MEKPKAPKKTAQEVAMEVRQRAMLDEEIKDTEDKLRTVKRGKLGAASMLGGGKKAKAGASSSSSRSYGSGSGSYSGGSTSGKRLMK